MHTFARIAFLLCAAHTLCAAELNTAKIEELTGLKGKLNEQEKVFKVSAPRTDVKVDVDGWRMPPFMGLTSWAAFMSGKDDNLMVMGDIVLFEDEVNAAMSAALDNGLEVTALHNHFLFDQPRVFFMHVGGEGPVARLAPGVKAVFAAVKDIRTKQPEPQRTFGGSPLPQQNTITPRNVEEVLGLKGEAKDGMLKVVVGRTAKMPCGCEVGREMGVNTWAAFAGSDENAVVDGDFAVGEDQLQKVLKSLRGSGINVVAIHSHMTGEQPRTLFLHYWGRGRSGDLAQAIKDALDAPAK